MLAALACLSAAQVNATDVGLAGVMGSKAMLMFNGGEPETVAVGQSLNGVKVIAIQGDQAIVEVDGKKRPLRVGQHAVGNAPAEGSGEVILKADGRGHFRAQGRINGVSQGFMVDTGASAIGLGRSDGQRLGLNLDRGQRVRVSTANGQVLATRITLDTVEVGGILLHNVDAIVHEADMPYALLGMTFLNRMEMRRDGDTMTLKKRF